MLTEEKRLLRMFYLLSETEGYKKASELAAKLQISERTVKKDVEQLKDLARKNGCRLEAVRGKGYVLKVEDPPCFEQSRESLAILFGNTEKGYKENPVYRIARAVMMEERADADGYFRLEDLAEALYISESDMKKKMAGVREFLGSFHLTLQSRPGRGQRLEGDELSRRFCFLELYENHFRKRVVTYQNQKYEEAFEDRGDKEEIRNTVLWIIRDSSLEMFDSFLNRMINYTLLMRNRMRAGRRIRREDCLWSRYQEELRRSREYRIAGQITEALGEFEGFERDDEETEALAVLLQIWEDLDEEDHLEECFPGLYGPAQDASRQLEEILTGRWNLPLSRIDSGFAGKMTPGMVRIFLQNRYGFSQARTVGNIVSDNNIKDSVQSMALADETALIIRERWGIVINEYNIQLLAVKFFRMINGISYSYIPRRLLVCSRNGRENARIIAEGIARRLGTDWIGRLTIEELYEGRKYPPEDYDCLIGTFPAYSYRYTWPYIKVGQIPQPEDYERIRREVVREGFDLKSVMDRCRWDTVWVHRDFAAGQTDGIFQLIAYQWGKDPEDKERLAGYFSEKRIARIHSQILTLMIPAGEAGRRIFELFLLKKPVTYMEKSVRAVVFAAVDFGGDPEILKLTEQILRKLSTGMEVLSRDVNSENIMDILTEKAREEL